MKICAAFLLVVLVCLSGVAGAKTPEAAPPPPEQAAQPQSFDRTKPIAKIGDRLITAGDFQQELRYRWLMHVQRTGSKTPPDASFREQVLDEMVNAVVVRLLAHAAGVQVNEAEVHRRYRDFERIRGKEAVEAYFKRENTTKDRVLEQLREKTLLDGYFKKLREEMPLEEDAVRAQYDALMEKGQLKRAKVTYDVAHIFIEAKDDSEVAWAAAKLALDAAHARVSAGEPFEKVANEVSEDEQAREMGGVYYEARPDEVPQSIRDVMVVLEVGEISAPFKSPLGWHTLKLLRENPAGEVVPFEKAQYQIRQALMAALVQAKLREEIEAYSKIIAIELYREAAAGVPVELETKGAQN